MNIDEQVFLEGGLFSNFFEGRAFDQCVYQTAEIVYHLINRYTVGITAIITWNRTIPGNSSAPISSNPNLWMHECRDPKKIPPVHHTRWKKYGMTKDRIDYSIRKLVEIWNYYYKKCKSIYLLDCFFIFYMDYTGRYQCQISKIDSNSPINITGNGDIINDKNVMPFVIESSKLLSNPDALNYLVSRLTPKKEVSIMNEKQEITDLEI